MLKFLKPTILWTCGGRDDHYTTIPRRRLGGFIFYVLALKSNWIKKSEVKIIFNTHAFLTTHFFNIFLTVYSSLKYKPLI
jgi:hypothetical protein